MVEKKVKKVSKKMSFTEIMEIAPEAGEVLFNSGMHCIGCGMAAFETLEQGAMAHGLDADKIVDEINKALLKKDLGEKPSGKLSGKESKKKKKK